MADTGTTTMTAVHREMHTAFNRRDWGAIRERMAPDCVYTDHARGETAHGPEEATALYEQWADAFSDGEIADGALYDDTGQMSIGRFIGRGSQDGQLGPFPPSGQWAETAFCELLQWNEHGLVVHGEIYYDQLSMLMQLGHIPAPEG